MTATLKLIHLAALVLGGGGAFASWVMLAALRRAGHAGPPPVPMAAALRMLTVTGLVAIVLLWFSGALLWGLAWRDTDLGWLFAAKLVAAGIVLAGSLALNVLAARAARGRPPDPANTARLGEVTRAAIAVALLLAVAVFG